MRKTLSQRLAALHERYQRARRSKKASEAIHREMVKLRTSQLRKANREDRREAS